QVALVLSIFIVDNDDHFAGANGLERLVDGREDALAPRAFREFQCCLLHKVLCPINRATYFPITSVSMLTAAPARFADNVVCSHVNGTICTRTCEPSSAAIVKLIPSSAIEPLWINNGANSAGTSTSSQ